jgi:hypothetical protein
VCVCVEKAHADSFEDANTFRALLPCAMLCSTVLCVVCSAVLCCAALACRRCAVLRSVIHSGMCHMSHTSHMSRMSQCPPVHPEVYRLWRFPSHQLMLLTTVHSVGPELDGDSRRIRVPVPPPDRRQRHSDINSSGLLLL